MEIVMIISIVVICITIIICTILNHFKDITDYYDLWHSWRDLNKKVDYIYNDLYSNQIISKTNEMHRDFYEKEIEIKVNQLYALHFDSTQLQTETK